MQKKSEGGGGKKDGYEKRGSILSLQNRKNTSRFRAPRPPSPLPPPLSLSLTPSQQPSPEITKIDYMYRVQFHREHKMIGKELLFVFSLTVKRK